MSDLRIYYQWKPEVFFVRSFNVSIVLMQHQDADKNVASILWKYFNKPLVASCSRILNLLSLDMKEVLTFELYQF